MDSLITSQKSIKLGDNGYSNAKCMQYKTSLGIWISETEWNSMKLRNIATIWFYVMELYGTFSKLLGLAQFMSENFPNFEWKFQSAFELWVSWWAEF